ncbi:MAG: hypothetical protein R2705_17095 [Ilumatobacteraceae bacterium]
MAKSTPGTRRARTRRLIEELRDAKQEALNLRFRNATGQRRTSQRSRLPAGRSLASTR